MLITCDWIKGKFQWGVFEGNACVATAKHHNRIISSLRRWMKKVGYNEVNVEWANDHKRETVTLVDPAKTKLEDKVQLHERIHIVYVVDGWEAIYYWQDGNEELCRAKGDTINQALRNLNKIAVKPQRGPHASSPNNRPKHSSSTYSRAFGS